MLNSSITSISSSQSVVKQSTVSKQKPDIPKVNALGIRLMQHIRTGFVDHCGRSWVPVINSVHELVAHSWQVMQVLDDQQSPLLLGDYTEQNQEAWNKYVNAFKSGPSSRARQTSIIDNTQDIFQRMLIMSHPEIASIKKRQKSCTKCGKLGHTARSIKFHCENVYNEEATAIQAMFLV